ncbi:MAG: response regulator [Thermoanaerobaculales bacterium]|jgi:DNA-binding NtrC family response regulator|nr:response regulator [Thermoanaerobaculales bacterium]
MKKNKINLLIVDDEERFLESISKSLELRDFNVIAVNRGDKAIEAAKQQPIDVALVDLKMPGISGEETLRQLKELNQWLEVVILTGHGAVQSAVDCTKLGAFSYLQKPCELSELIEALQAAYKQKVMNHRQLEQKKIEKMLRISGSASPRDIIRRLLEIDEGSS